MALRLGALHDALLHPGDPDLAQKAAEEVAGYERQMTEIRADVSLVKWMLATLMTLQIAFGIGNVWLTLNVLARLGGGPAT